MVVSPKKILLFNCDSDTTESLTGFLDQEPEPYRVLTADTDEDAFTTLAADDIFLIAIFTEECHRFPHPLLKKIIADDPQLKIILILPPDNDRIRSAIPPHTGLHIIEKPYKPFSIIHLIRELSSHKQNLGFTGTLKIVRLDDLIQMCCLSGATITILVANEDQRGEIFIQEGEIIHARCGEISGEQAFYSIMTWHNGGFETLDGVPDKAATINANYQYLLLEAARLSDESGKPAETDADELLTTAEVDLAETKKLRVLMVEDSTVMAKIMSTMLLVTGDIEIAGIAHNGQEALEMMEILQFDVVLLDVNMPVMNGRVTIKHIMIKSPCPIVIMSNVGSRAPETVLSLLDLGAVDFISKPVRGGDFLLQQQKIVERIRRSATARISAFRRFRAPKNSKTSTQIPTDPGSSPAKQLVIISSGGNGHTALYHLFTGIPASDEAAFVSLHSIPVTFLPAMSAHLSQMCHHPVSPVANDTPLQGGNFYLDSQRRSLLLQATDDSVKIQSLQGQHDFEYGPGYFDLFLFSAADVFQGRLLVILLSGAETSNLEGLRYVREKGGSIIVQERSSCMMPDCLTPVIEENLSDEELAPEALANRVVTWTEGYFQI